MTTDHSNPNAVLFTYTEETAHNQRVLKAIADMYAIHIALGNTARATKLRKRYFCFLRDYKIGVETE